MHFGLRGRQDWHHDMKVEVLSFQKDDGGVEFEGLTKTRGGLRVKLRLATPKMFATGMKRCPVAFSKKLLDKRPAELKATGPVYLNVIDKPQTSLWYTTMPMGKNTINVIIETMKETSERCLPRQMLTSHSATK